MLGHMPNSLRINNPFLRRGGGPIVRVHNQMCIVKGSNSIVKKHLITPYLFGKLFNLLKTRNARFEGVPFFMTEIADVFLLLGGLPLGILELMLSCGDSF